MVNVLIVGASGYLGQFLLDYFVRLPQHRVAYTYHSRPLPPLTAAKEEVNAAISVQAVRADLISGDGLWEAVLAAGPAQVVVNCAAVSQPGVCERDYAAASSINVPTKLVEALKKLQLETGDEALLVHVSTDQVYDGSRAWWSESDATQPVNAYGRSKLAAEEFLRQQWPRHVALRSSIIYGPQPPFAPVDRALFLQFVEGVVRSQKPTDFFSDEYRCPIYVGDICAIVGHLAQLHPRLPPSSTYNMGGPERLSRVDMAMAVAQHLRVDTACVLSSASAGINRGYASPPDISMKMEQLLADLPSIRLTPFAEALQQALSA